LWKVNNLKAQKSTKLVLNFGGHNAELCVKVESWFLQMIYESANIPAMFGSLPT
jgi:hypothetical protein